MYIKLRKREGKKETIYYFYKTVNTRIDGKVKTKQDYICKLSEYEIYDIDRLMNRKLCDLRNKDFKVWLKLITKIQFDILEKSKDITKALEI